MNRSQHRLSFVLGVLALSWSAMLEAQNFPVGNRSMSLTDASRNRTITLDLYYPAQAAGANTPLASGAFPLLTFGHGFVIPASTYSEFASHWAAMGIAVALPSTESGFAPNHSNFGLDIAFINQYFRTNQDAFFQCNGITAIGGHSMGGGAAVLGNAGVQAELYIGLAPAITNPDPLQAAAGLQMPVLILSGTSDGVTPPDAHHVPIFNACASSCKMLVHLQGGNHCYYIPSSICDLGEIGSSATLSREQQQAIMFDYLEPFVRLFLLQDSNNWVAFVNGIPNDNRVSVDNACPLSVEAMDATAGFSNVIYPQPAKGSFQVRGISEQSQVVLRNAFGQEIPATLQWNEGVLHVDLKSSNSGLIWLDVRDSYGRSSTYKVMLIE